jgi:hypothetical protein
MAGSIPEVTQRHHIIALNQETHPQPTLAVELSPRVTPVYAQSRIGNKLGRPC